MGPSTKQAIIDVCLVENGRTWEWLHPVSRGALEDWVQGYVPWSQEMVRFMSFNSLQLDVLDCMTALVRGF